MMEENLRQRATKKLLRVTMPDGTVICHKSATMTMIDVLVAIGSENFHKITTENCHLPLLSKEIYSRYKDYMKPVCDGWYINAQSDTGQKYMQLTSIKSQLGIAMEVEMGTGFITSGAKVVQKAKKKDDKPSARPDYLRSDNPEKDAALENLWQLMVKDQVYDPTVIQAVVAEKEYYDLTTPIRDYDIDFIEGCLIEAWPEVNKLAQTKINDLPF